MNRTQGTASASQLATPHRGAASLLALDGEVVGALLESASEAIVGSDRAGGIVLANARTEAMFGYSRRELLGHRIEMLLPEALRTSHERHRTEYFASPRVRPMGAGMELSGRRKDGTLFPVEVSLSHVRTAKGLFAIAFVSDITQRKTLEEQLLHAQKMEAVGRLAGGVAHDFNNMLTVIAGYNQMILDRVSPIDPLRGYAEEILKAAERAAALTNQLLAFSRRQIVQPRVFDVNAVLSRSGQMLRRLIGEDVEFAFNLNPNAGNIRADPGHLEQALFNLATNARDAMPKGGRITIETEPVTLDGLYTQTHLGVAPGQYVMIAVSDNGLGMDAETRLRIFEPFFTTKESGKGTGLGLATVYGIVKQAGGDIWVYSEVGKGTTFKLYFPVVQEPASGPESDKVSADEDVGRKTVLLVEDEQSVRELTAKMLQLMGYTALTAASGPEALALADVHEGAIDLLLTDVVMPGMGGQPLAEELRRRRPEIRVVFVSGYTENTISHRGVMDHGAGFLAKPFGRDALSAKLREALSKR